MSIYVIDCYGKLFEFDLVTSIVPTYHKGKYILVINYVDIYDKPHWYMFEYDNIKSVELLL